jgi:hypothetical protein
MKTRINIVYSSHLSEEENNVFEKHVSDTIGTPHKIFGYPNFNEYSLPEVYNRAIKEIGENPKEITVFCHNDIEFDTYDWGVKLLKHFNNPNNDYQIIGVAGSDVLYEHACWWLTQDGSGMNGESMIGIVNHDNGIRKWTSKYSEPHYGVRPVILIDGLFMAVDLSEIENKFDENFKGFHFYDVSFCIPNYLDGCNIGIITDIRITHKSIGQTNKEWDLNRAQFAEKYKEYLPLKVEE